jgi:tyrosine-protein phosphatase YwqE
MFQIFKSKKTTILPNIGFKTDLHSHLLPGIDDGSDSVEESIELITRLQNMGIERFITTPHIAESAFPNTIVEISESYQRLSLALKEANLDVNLRYSAEYRLDDNYIELFQNNQLIPFPGNYVLIENSYYQAFWGIDELIFKMITAGFHPILAHPERYRYYGNDTASYEKLHNLGCKFQVNILSFAGSYGKEAKVAANYLLNYGYIDFLATDAHHIRHIETLEQFCGTSEYKKILSKVALMNDHIPSF